MPATPTYAGATAPLWTESLITDSGAANLTGVIAANISMIFKNTANGANTTGTGTILISQANPAIITYQPSAGDVANPRLYHAFCWVTFPVTGPQPFDLGIWEILPA